MNLNYLQLSKINRIAENKDQDGDSIYYMTEYMSDCIEENFNDVEFIMSEIELTNLMRDTYKNDIRERLKSIIMNQDLVFAYKIITEK